MHVGPRRGRFRAGAALDQRLEAGADELVPALRHLLGDLAVKGTHCPQAEAQERAFVGARKVERGDPQRDAEVEAPGQLEVTRR
jgi:hypothetical protein